MTGPDADRRAKSSSVLVPRPSALLREEAQPFDFGASQSIWGRSVPATEAEIMGETQTRIQQNNGAPKIAPAQLHRSYLMPFG